MQNNQIQIYSIVILLFTITIYSNGIIFAEQVTGQVSIINLQDIPSGGTATITTPQGVTLSLSLPPGQAATLTGQISTPTNPTSGGSSISFLAEVLTINITPTNACTAGCDILFTFDDSHLAASSLTDPNQVIIFQDSQLDGTFVPLPTLLIDGSPSPYTVLATITSTSFFGIGVLAEETFCGKTLEQWEAEGANIVFGTDERDKLRGTKNVDVIFGLGGNDRILGGDGDDCLIGGEGNDRIIGGKGNDIIFGNDGKDRLHGAKGNDTIDGGNGDDRSHGNNGNDQLSGGDGNDKLFGNKGNDFLVGLAGNDMIFGGQGDDNIDGGEGTDKCKDGSGQDTIVNCEDKKQ